MRTRMMKNGRARATGVGVRRIVLSTPAGTKPVRKPDSAVAGEVSFLGFLFVSSGYFGNSGLGSSGSGWIVGDGAAVGLSDGSGESVGLTGGLGVLEGAVYMYDAIEALLNGSVKMF